MVYPTSYYQNITASTVALVRAMHRAAVTKLIFSSSCATFGGEREEHTAAPRAFIAFAIIIARTRRHRTRTRRRRTRRGAVRALGTRP